MTRMPWTIQRGPKHDQDGVLFPRGDSARVVACLAGCDAARAFQTTLGVLVTGVREPVPDAVAMRNVAGGFWVPRDAVLLPALLADEVANLATGRSVVVLRGALATFNGDHEVPLRELLAANIHERREWQPLPEAPKSAEALNLLVRDTEASDIEKLLADNAFGPPDQPKTAETDSATSRTAARTQIAAGRLIEGMGNALRLDALANMGGRMVDRGLSKSPQIAEQILGKQQAALRELMRNFREGNVDDALRRAMPIGDDEGGGRREQNFGTRLPFQNLRYSLGALLGRGGRDDARAGGSWHVEETMLDQIRREYRRVAKQAEDAGDHRRAAWVYGKLLKDWAGAANCLRRAGLHADAAKVFEQKLHNVAQAAEEYDKAGDIQNALRLYRRQERFEPAAAMLRRVGQEQEAIAEFERAAEKLASLHHWHRAGVMLRDQAHQSDKAEAMFLRGWLAAYNADTLAVGMAIQSAYADHGDADKLLAFVGEGVERVKSNRRPDDAARFLHHAGHLATLPEMAEARDDLEDLALMGAADFLRDGPSGDRAEAMFDPKFTDPVVYADALFSVRAEQRRNDAAIDVTDLTTTIQLAGNEEAVVDVCPWRDGVAVMLTSGRTISFSTKRGSEVLAFRAQRMATNPNGRHVVTRSDGDVTFWNAGKWTPHTRIESVEIGSEREARWWCANEQFSLVSTPRSVKLFDARGPRVHELDGLVKHPAVLFATQRGDTPLLISGRNVQRLTVGRGSVDLGVPTMLSWEPDRIAGWFLSDRHLQILSTDATGKLWYGELFLETALAFDAVRVKIDRQVLAFAFTGYATFAVVTSARVLWIQRRSDAFDVIQESEMDAADAVGCVWLRGSGELAVVHRDTRVTLVRRPSQVKLNA